MKRNVPLLALALTLVLSSAAFAGGAKCAHDAKVAAHDSKKAELAAKGWMGFKTEKDASGAYRVASVTPGSPQGNSARHWRQASRSSPMMDCM